MDNPGYCRLAVSHAVYEYLSRTHSKDDWRQGHVEKPDKSGEGKVAQFCGVCLYRIVDRNDEFDLLRRVDTNKCLNSIKQVTNIIVTAFSDI